MKQEIEKLNTRRAFLKLSVSGLAAAILMPVLPTTAEAFITSHDLDLVLQDSTQAMRENARKKSRKRRRKRKSSRRKVAKRQVQEPAPKRKSKSGKLTEGRAPLKKVAKEQSNPLDGFTPGSNGGGSGSGGANGWR